MDACREIKIYAIDQEVDFGLRIDPITIVGGTYLEIQGLFSDTPLSMIGYKIYPDNKLMYSMTSEDLYTIINGDGNFIYKGSALLNTNTLLLVIFYLVMIMFFSFYYPISKEIGKFTGSVLLLRKGKFMFLCMIYLSNTMEMVMDPELLMLVSRPILQKSN